MLSLRDSGRARRCIRTARRLSGPGRPAVRRDLRDRLTPTRVATASDPVTDMARCTRRRSTLRAAWQTGVGGLRHMPLAVWVAAVAAVYLNVMNGILNTFFPLLALLLGLSLSQAGLLASIRSGVSPSPGSYPYRCSSGSPRRGFGFLRWQRPP